MNDGTILLQHLLKTPQEDFRLDFQKGFIPDSARDRRN